MNQKKIGLFIAKCRKTKKLTQMELAEKLGVSDRSISNWENGICLPDASLYRPLCDVLGITINELFAGEFISDEQYKMVADNNLLQVLENRLYKMSSKEIGFEEFDESLKRISEMVILLKKYSDKKDAVKYLMEQTGLSEQECSFAYDFFITMFDKKYYYR